MSAATATTLRLSIETQCSHKTVGTKQGAGYTVNIAWEGPGASDSEYIAAFQRIILPIATAFKPQVSEH